MTSHSEFPDLVPLGSRWPSGKYCNVALLDIQGDDIERKLGCELASGSEPGLGTWRAIGLRLKSGALIELIEYLHQPTKGFELRADSSCSMGDVLGETLAALGRGPECVVWRSPLISA
jgi:hypothetical protein